MRDQADLDLIELNDEACVVCGGGEHQVAYASTFHGTVDEAAEYFLAHRRMTAHGQIRRCRGCGFVFTSPRFSPEEYDRIYSGIRAPEFLDPAFHDAKVARFRRLTSIVGRHAGRGDAFLDFGCGDGSFLEVNDDPRGRGFEVGAPGRTWVGASEIILGQWASFAGSPDCPPDSLDYITAFDVLEHLPRLEEDLSLIRTVLKPRGLLFASVPNIDSLVAKLMAGRWNMLLLEHLWYFSPRTLARLLDRIGFEQVEVRHVPFDAPLAHVNTRIAQTFGMKGVFDTGPLSRMIIPAPAGIMLGVYRKR
jgi:SAM-dependent methyltransferase